MPTKYIIVTGGVLSGLGKGVATASLGAILTMMGVTRFTIKKLDPYLNVDPGTMNPIEHGEVFVTQDGAETDLDIGYYERFANIHATSRNSTSSGKLFQRLLERERNGDFLGHTVQMIPHFTNELKAFIRQDEEQYDAILCEIGGSVGDIEAMAFYEALRQLRVDVGGGNFALVHLTYLVHYRASNELKTKPAQNAIRELMQTGLQPDILLCRTEQDTGETASEQDASQLSSPTQPSQPVLPSSVRHKLSQFCSRIVHAPNVHSIYQIPLQFVRQGMHTHLHTLLQVGTAPEHVQLHTTPWTRLEHTLQRLYPTPSPCSQPLAHLPMASCPLASRPLASRQRLVTIAIVGKYVQLHDAYCSLLEAVHHAAWMLSGGPGEHTHVDHPPPFSSAQTPPIRIQFVWYDARAPPSNRRAFLERVDAVIVPGGFGATGLNEIVDCLTDVRALNLPTLGICLGMQLMVVEYLRNVGGMVRAVTEEMVGTGTETIDSETETANVVVGLMEQWETEHLPKHLPKTTTTATPSKTTTRNRATPKGGTMRLGNYTVHLTPGTLAHSLYPATPNISNNTPNNTPTNSSSGFAPYSSHSSHFSHSSHSPQTTTTTCTERHRHRYEVKPACVSTLEENGMCVSGQRDGLVEVVEVANNSYYLGCQFHPEYRSSPFAPHPLFVGLLRAVVGK